MDLKQEGYSVSVVNCRFVKPLDQRLSDMAARIRKVLIVEENTLQGGFGSGILELFADQGLSNILIKRLGIPDTFVEHGPQDLLREQCGIGRNKIIEETRKLCSYHGPAKEKT